MTRCTHCHQPATTEIRDVPGGAVLWSCDAAECRAEVLVVVVERDGMRENDGRLTAREVRR